MTLPRTPVHPTAWAPQDEHLVARRPVTTLAKVLAAALVLLATAGIAARATGSPSLELLDLDEERRLAAMLSSGILGLASYLLFRGLATSRASLIHFALPLFLLFMALDEVVYLHERLEWHAGVDWQLLYSPLIAGGGVAWLLVVTLYGWRSSVGRLLIAGATCWGVSQVLEAVQWNGDVKVAGYGYYMVVEELLEATGSAFFCLAGAALLSVAQRRSAGQD